MDDIITALGDFYKHYDPKNVPDKATLDGLAKDYAGREKDLWTDLYGHYDPKNPPKEEDLTDLSSLSNPFGAEKKNATGSEGSLQPLETASGAIPVEQSPALEPEKPLAEDMGRISRRFQELGNEARIKAQAATVEAQSHKDQYQLAESLGLSGSLSAKDYKVHLENWGTEEEKAKVAKLKETAEQQPLTTRLMEYYVRKLGTGGGSRTLDTGRDDAIGRVAFEMMGTPKGAELEQRLQRLYKTVDADDSRSLENAMLDAKQIMLKMMPEKDNSVWNDFAEQNERFSEYDPVGYHQRLNNQIVTRYSQAGMDEETAYRKLMLETLENGVMDEDRVHEAKLIMTADQLRKDLARAEHEGSQVRIDQAKYRLAEAEKAVKGMESERLGAVDQHIADLEMLLEMDSPPEPRADLREKLERTKAMRHGFINPAAKIEAAYAKYQPDADSALPEGTPMEKLRRLYSELQWDRRQTIKRMRDAEGGGGDLAFAGQEMLNALEGHNDDHRRLIRIESQLKDLAPIVFLNESPAVRDDKAGFGPSFWNGMLTTIGGEGSPLSGTTRQQDALMLQRNLQIAGVAPELLNDPKMPGVADRTADPELASGEFAGNMLGTSAGLMYHIMMAAVGTKGIGMGKAIQGLIGAEKYGGAALALLGDAVESGLNYHVAGMISVDNKDELNLMSGFFGGLAGSVGKSGFQGAKTAIAGVFGDKAADAAKAIANWGGQRLGAGVGESFEETGQQLVQMWQQSSTGQEFWEKFGKQFGDLSELAKFYVSTMAMGAFMGGVHSDGLGKYLSDYARDQIEMLPPADRRQAEAATDMFMEEADALVEGAQGDGREPESKPGDERPAMELTPEAQAAQEELKKRRQLDQTMREQGLGDRTDQTMTDEEKIRAELQALKDKEQGVNQPGLQVNPEGHPDFVNQEGGLSDAEQKRKKHLETVVTGLDQMRDQTAFREVEPETEEVSEEIETSEATPSNTIEIEGKQIELPVLDIPVPPVSPATETVSPQAEPITVAPEQQPETPKRRDEVISDQINEFFNGIAGSIGQAAADKIRSYADRIMGGESRESIIEGLPQAWVDAIDRAVELQRNPAPEQQVTPETERESLAPVERKPPAVDDVVEFNQGPKGRQTRRSGKVLEILPNGSYRVEMEVGGEKTTAIVKPENLVQPETTLEVVPTVEVQAEAVQPSTETPAAQEPSAPATPPQTQQGSVTIDQATAIDVGIQVANQLAQNGLHTRENWMKAMQSYGDIMSPHLDRAWEVVNRAVPEGTTKEKSKGRQQEAGREQGIQAQVDRIAVELQASWGLSKKAANRVSHVIGAVARSMERLGIAPAADRYLAGIGFRRAAGESESALQSAPAERQRIIALAKANGTYMLAPNGEPTNLTESQWVQVRTKAFKEWFGDWENDPQNASKMLDDETGEPRVFYHGSESRFDTFDINRAGSVTDSGWLGTGIYFSEDEYMASLHGREALDRKRKYKAEPWTGAFFLNVRNPYMATSAEKDALMHENNKGASGKFREKVRQAGHDGVVLTEDGEIEVAVHEPSQIKSATDNTGAFDPNNPSTLMQDANAQYRVESGRRIAEILQDLSHGNATAAAFHEAVFHDALFNIIAAAQTGNKAATELARTIIEEYNKTVEAGSRVTLEQVMEGNSALAQGKSLPKNYRAFQEFFARAGERYLREGPKGFGKKMQKVLDAVKEVFAQIYNDIKGSAIDVPLTPRLRKVFDDILGKESEKKEKQKDGGPEKTGTQLLMERHIDTASDALAEEVTDNPMFKGDYNQRERFKKAVRAVKAAIKAGKIGEMVDKLVNKASTTAEVDHDQFQRMAIIRMYGAMADESRRLANEATLAGDEKAAKRHAKEAGMFTENMTAMLHAMSENALGAGRGGAASALWQSLGDSMDRYALAVMEHANDQIMSKKKASNGKQLDEAINDATENLNGIAESNADAIANSVDAEIDQGAKESKPKKRETTIAGMTRAEARAAKKKALEEFNSIHLSGTANAMLAPAGFAKTVALAKIGFYAMAEGAIAFNDWMANMRRTVPNVTDQELRDAWEADANGRNLKEESEKLMRQRALDSITRTLESTGTSENSETEKETKKIRDEMARELTQTIADGGTLDDFKKKHGLTDQQADDLAEAILNATPEALDKLAGNRAKARQVQFAAESYLPKEKRAKTRDQKAQEAARAETRKKVKETIRDHFKDPDGRPLIDKLVEAGLDPDQAQKVEDAVRANAQRIMQQAVAGELDHIASNESKRKNRDYKPPKKRPHKNQTEVLIDRLVDGRITNRYLQGLLAHRYGLAPPPTAEQIQRIRDLGKAVATARGVMKKVALRQLGITVDAIMPVTKTESLIGLYEGLIFASTLNSLSTFGVNVSSVFDHYLLGIVKPLIDPMQYFDFFSALVKGNRNALLLNPIAKIIIKGMGNVKPFVNGFNAFISGVQTGVSSSRYDESITESDPAKLVPALERMQRTAFGRWLLSPRWWNPFSHIFGKLVGRILSATDAATTTMYGDLEFLDALRIAAGNQNKPWKQLRKEIGEYLATNSQLWRDSMAQAESEAATVQQMTGTEVKPATIKARAREIARQQFSQAAGISEADLQSVQNAAQYNTMTLKRQGGFGKLAQAIAKAKASSPIARVALFPFFMFTEIPGNFGDAMLDNTPVYNLIRLAGLSPTGLARRWGKTETSARLGDSWQSRERRKQIEGAAFSTILTIAAYALLKADEDDDDITKKEQSGSGQDFKLFGIPFKNFASIGPALVMAKVLDEYDKAPSTAVGNEAGPILGRMAALGSAMASFYTEQSFVKGIRDLATAGTGVFRSIKEEGSMASAIKGVTKSVLRPFLSSALKPLPTAQGVVRFMEDVMDPHKYSEESMTEFFMYSMGLQHFTNERKVDVFGEEIYVLPGDNVIPVQGLLEWVTGPKNPNKDLYAFLRKTNTLLEAPSNSMEKWVDENSPTGFTVRDMEPGEWKSFNITAGNKFRDKLRDYMETADDDDIKIKGNKFLSAAQKDILEMWSSAKTAAKKELFGDLILSDKEAQQSLDEFLDQ